MSSNHNRALGDYTVTPRLLLITLIAVAIGFSCSYVAFALLRMIALATNIFFFQRFTFAPVSPAEHHLGVWVIIVPVIGGLIIGIMARYGSDRIRGHGIPEAIESILLRGSRVNPKVAVLKPLSAAVSIGSGGPFGAEGPIIMTGGAIGSLIAQFFHLTDTERKTLLVAGSAAGMAAVFAAPVAAVFLAFELLLFELKPRSLVPVALASATAAAARVHLLGYGPLFPKTPHAIAFSAHVLLGALLLGALSSVLAMAMTKAVYAAEDAFEHLPIHWMWWPCLGGLIIGIGGYIFPQGFGVGYEYIAALLQSDLPIKIILGILCVKSLMWALSLGSGTSGGVLAPLLMVGGALGAAVTHFFPAVFPFEGGGFWAAISMAAVLGATLGIPLTAIIFAIELTQDMNMLLPLLLATVVAYALNILVLRRSILTEKISRRGYHLSREYSVDPLEIMFVREAMRTNVLALPQTISTNALRESLSSDHARRGQWLYPIVDEQKVLLGVLTRNELQKISAECAAEQIDVALGELCTPQRKLVVAYPDEPLRIVVNRMAESGLTRFPVVDRRAADRQDASKRGSDGGPGARLVGLVSITDLLKARVANLHAEHKRQRVIPVRVFLPARFRSSSASPE